MQAWTFRAAALAAVSAGMLAGSSAPAQPGQVPSVPEMQPGSYTETVSFISVSGSVPPELRQAVRDKASNTTQFCYNPEPVSGRRPSIFEVHAGKDCRLASATQTGDTASVGMACQDSGTRGTMTFDGNFRPASATFKVSVAVDFLTQKRSMAYISQVKWERTGETCDAD